MAPPAWVVVLTLTAYTGFAVAYGADIFAGGDHGSCSFIIDCVPVLLGFLGDFVDLLTLGGLASPLPVYVQGPLLLALFIGWGSWIVERFSEAI